MQQIYTLGIYLLAFITKLYALFNLKASKLIKGHTETKILLNDISVEKYIWVHVASLGEFEQGKPIIEKIKNDFPNSKILLTFFSPSGFEVKKDYPLADVVCYLPFDTVRNARLFVEHFNITAAIFIKYEFWFNYLKALHKRKIPTFYVSSNFRRGQYFFSWYGKWFLNQLKKVDHFFVQNPNSEQLLKENNIPQVSIVGDTRFDTVLLNAKKVWEEPKIKGSIDGRQVIVFGSTWPIDHNCIIDFINKNGSKYQYIIAPHEIKEEELLRLKSLINIDVACFSDPNDFNDVLLIDSIGLLKYIYRYGDVAYIGGGFGKGIHNTLEPLSYNIPVVFGPKFYKFQEAIEIIDKNIGGTILKESEFTNVLESWINISSNDENIKTRIQEFIGENKGAAEKVLKKLTF